MDVEGSWNRIKHHRSRLSDDEIRGIAEVLFHGQEEWLEEKLLYREDTALAIEFLGYMGKGGSERAVRVLLKLLGAGEEVLQIAAAEALKLCPDGLVVAPLAELMLKQNQSSVKAGEIISSFGAIGAQVLWELWFCENRTTGLKSQIIQLMAELDDNRLENLLYLAFMSGEEELIRPALTAAEKIEAKGLWGNVAECLAHPGWLIRGRAVRLLGKWGEKQALPYVLDMGADQDAWVEEERQKAITLLRGSTLKLI